MWNYEKRLQYPVNIMKPNAKLAKVIMSQFGGPDGELWASQRYLSQRYSMGNRKVAGVLTDIGTSVSEMFHLPQIEDKPQGYWHQFYSISTRNRVAKWDGTTNEEGSDFPYKVSRGEGLRVVNFYLGVSEKQLSELYISKNPFVLTPASRFHFSHTKPPY